MRRTTLWRTNMDYREFINKIRESGIIEEILTSGELLTCESACDKFYDYFEGQAWVGSGATKLVIIPNDADYVIKIPFDAWNDGTMFDENDYCELEEIAYDKAAQNGLDYLFMPTRFVESISTVKIYVQDRVDGYAYDTDDDQLTDDELDEIECIKTSSGVTCEVSSFWVHEFLEVYGEDTFDEFTNFLTCFGINDLHSGNVGYWNNKPVIFDYSGYYEESYARCTLRKAV